MTRTHTAVCLLGLVLGGCELMSAGPGGWPPTRPASAPATAPATGAPSTQPGRGEATAPAILEPSQGRPIIVRPGDRFYFLTRLGETFEGDIYVSLVHSEVGEVYFPLALAGELTVRPQKHTSMVLQVPAEAPEGLYDLRARGGARTLTARHSVKVVRDLKTRFRFVHLSNMDIGDPTAPDFDPRLPEEINLLAPEFIVATGDFILPEATVDGRTPWSVVLDYFARFRAPVYLVCGEHDDEASFVPTAAASPIGSFTYGRYHGVLLLNNPAHPIDAEQIDFVRRDLAENRDAALCFLAMNDDDPRFLNKLAAPESAVAFAHANALSILLCGGDGDWDGHEYAAALAGLSGLHYIRTHAASTSRRGRATGTSHYRVIEVNGRDMSYVYPTDTACGEAQPSIPVGSLGVRIIGDGANPPASATVVIRNGLNQPFSDCRVWVRLAKRDNTKPRVAGARLVQVLDARTAWLCEIGTDVPDCAGVRIAVSTDRDPPGPLPVAVEFVADEELSFTSAQTATGLRYAASNGRVILRVRNTSKQPLTLRPIARLQGQVLSVAAPEPLRWPLVIEAGQAAELPLKLLLPDVVEGRHYVQVCFDEDPLQRLYLHPVVLRRSSPPTTRASR